MSFNLAYQFYLGSPQNWHVIFKLLLELHIIKFCPPQKCYLKCIHKEHRKEDRLEQSTPKVAMGKSLQQVKADHQTVLHQKLSLRIVHLTWPMNLFLKKHNRTILKQKKTWAGIKRMIFNPLRTSELQSYLKCNVL